MTTWPKPSKAQLREAFDLFGVRWREHSGCSNGRSAWSSGLRAATVHHTAGKNSADYLSSFNYGGANCCISNGAYNDSDGVAVIISWGDCYHSGDGGPWSGVAGRNSLHLVSWGIEVESIGTKRDITPKQIETVGRMLAALEWLGMPHRNIHRHADWTDGTGPVGGYPLPTTGRKIDTRKDLGYTTEFWKDKAKDYGRSKTWDGQVPSRERVRKGRENPGTENQALWRLQCRLYDLGYRTNKPVEPADEPKYPRDSLTSFQKKNVEINDPDNYGEFNQKTQYALFGEDKA